MQGLVTAPFGCIVGSRGESFTSLIPMASYLEKIEADRQAQHSGYGTRRFHCGDGTIKWEAYGWECITELTRHYTSYALFDHKWEAEQYFNNILNG
jgi:hypothetical protein